MTARTILHVSESLGGGVLSAIEGIVRTSPRYRHFILGANPRGSKAIELGPGPDYVMAATPLRAYRQVRRLIATLDPDVVHAHSTFAGILVRLSTTKRHRLIIYSPHCFAFERLDLPLVTRSLIYLLELLLTLNTSKIASCSPRETRLVMRWPVRADYLPNVFDYSPIEEPPARERVAVGMGRLSKQKDPQYFARVASCMRGLETTWLGGGDPSQVLELESQGTKVSGWIPRDNLLKRLALASVYLHTASWEGFPFSIIEAIDRGVPTLVRDVPAFSDTPPAVRTSTPEDMAARATHIISSADAARANVAAWRTYIEPWLSPSIEERLSSLYEDG